MLPERRSILLVRMEVDNGLDAKSVLLSECCVDTRTRKPVGVAMFSPIGFRRNLSEYLCFRVRVIQPNTKPFPLRLRPQNLWVLISKVKRWVMAQFEFSSQL